MVNRTAIVTIGALFVFAAKAVPAGVLPIGACAGDRRTSSPPRGLPLGRQ